MGWRRTSDCLMCGQDRCLENREESGVGYCYRFGTMHRNGKPFIKKGAMPPKAEHWTVLGKGVEVGSGEGKGEKAVSEKGCPPSPPQARKGQMEFGFDE